MSTEVPIDKYNIVYIILLIHGIGTLLPWNMFITANDYFVMKLTPGNGTNDTSSADHMINYKDNFLSYVGIASKLPNTAVQLANFLVHINVRSLKIRILVSIVAQAICFAVTTGLAIVDSSNWIATFFNVTMGTVVVVNIWNGIYQNCLYGQVAMLPAKYMNALVTGMNISGVVTSLFMIIALAAAPDLRTSAIVYFTTAVVFLILCWATYEYLTKTEYFSYYLNRKEDTPDVTGPLTAEFKSRPPYLLILKQIWIHLFSVFFVYFITLALFPALLAAIVSNTSLAGKYFTVVWCFLSFNLFAMLGNIAVDFFPNLINQRRLWIWVLARMIFIPFFVFCNVKAETRTAPVFFYNDTFYIIGVALFALTSGYMSSVAITVAPKSVDPQHASIAGMMSLVHAHGRDRDRHLVLFPLRQHHLIVRQPSQLMIHE